MDILPCKEEEEEEECAAMELKQAVDPGIQSSGRDNDMITTHYGFSGESSDEDDYTITVGNEDCVCCVCGELFPFLDQLMEHFKTHKDEVCCNLCQTNFSRAISLALHLKYAHPRHHLFCTICQAPFVSTWHLNEHLENHQKELTTHKEEVELVDVKPLIEMIDTDDIIESISIQSWGSMFLHDHSYCLPGHLNVSHSKAIQVQTRTCIRKCNDIVKCLPMDSLSKGAQQGSSSYFTVTSQHVKIVFNKEAQNNSPSSSRSSSPSGQSESACEEEYVIPGEEESTDTAAEEEDDALHSGDTDYSLDEDLSSDSEFSTGFNTDNSKSSLVSCHEKTHANHSTNAESFTCSELLESKTLPTSQSDSPDVKFESQTLSISQTNSSTIKLEPQTLPVSQTDSSPIKFGSQTPPTSQTDSFTIKVESQTPPTSPTESSASTFESQTLPTSRTDSSTSAEKNGNDCEKNPTFSCRMCKEECKNRDMLLKHIAKKHPTAVYICEGCFNTFPQQDAFQRHACWKRPTGQMSVLLATPGTPFPSPAVASTKLSQNLKITNLVPTVTPVTKICETVGQTVTTLPQTTVPTQTRPFGPAKLTDLHPQAVTPPPTLERPHCPPSIPVARPNVPVNLPSIVRASFPNQTMTTLVGIRNFNPSLQTWNKIVVSFSPTVPNFSAPILVSGNSNKSMPAPKLSQLPGNPPVNSSSTVRPFLPNQSMTTVHIPKPFNPSPQTQKKFLVTLSPTVNGPAPIQVSGNSNKSIPAPRQKFVANITPSQLPGNIPGHSPSIVRTSLPKQSTTTICQNQIVGSFSPTVPNFSAPISVSSNNNKSIPASKPLTLPANALVTHVSCPTLVSALLQKNQLKVSSHTSSAKVQDPTTGSLKAVAMSRSKRKDLAPKKTWRSKSIFPCRHCGAISRQPSLRLRHRYLRQRSRLYRCKCGSSFQRQLHLLRHQVQHAESVRFVCACCGSTFNGAHELARHKQGLKTKHRQYAKKQCISAFDCICGKLFARPSALLWHMLKNTKTLKHTHKKHGGSNEPASAV